MSQTKNNDLEDDGSIKNQRTGMETVPNPPTFFEKDMEFRFSEKYKKHISKREEEKRQLSKTSIINCLTKNINIKAADDQEKVAKQHVKSLR